MDKAEKIIYVHENPHGKKRLSTKGRIHPEGVKYIRADFAEQENKALEKKIIEDKKEYKKELQKVVSARIEELEKNNAVEVQTHYRTLWLELKTKTKEKDRHIAQAMNRQASKPK